MERLYNPDLMPEAEIKATFVAREPLLDELLAIVAGQPQGAGVQHIVLVAPRGMGKTTLLLMVQFALADRQLDAQWQAVRFPEESYAITDLADFWLETLRHLSIAIERPELDQIADDLLDKYGRKQDLEEAALAQLRQWSRENGKRLLLLVDNFDQILEQIRNERDEAGLRNVLMNDGTFMLIGAAPAHFREISHYESPLYNFFKVFHLEELEFEQILELLRQRAAADNVPDYEEVLRANKVKLKVLRYFTGGNPRLILMLYRVVSQSEVGEVREGLEKLLDEVTPYYKAKIDSLPAQQRKILDHIARISAQTNEGLTPSEIGKATRISAQAASSQLKRLADLGYVRAANLRGRNSYYALSEPLYAIWHQMRFGRGPQKRVGWLVNFLKQWYSDEEKPLESARLSGLFKKFMRAGERNMAQSALSHLHCLSLAMDDHPARAQAVEDVVVGHLRLGEYKLIEQEILPQLDLDDLSSSTLMRLLERGCLSPPKWTELALLRSDILADFKNGGDFIQVLEDARLAVEEKRFEDAITIADGILQVVQTPFLKAKALGVKGSVFFYQDDFETAKIHILDSLEIDGDSPALLIMLSTCVFMAGDIPSAINYIDEAKCHMNSKTLESHVFPGLLATKMLYFAFNDDIDAAAHLLPQLVTYSNHLKYWGVSTLQALQILAFQGHARRVREVIAETQTEEIFFPLARALDYLFSGDEALIEKLSPEMRPLVSEIVDKLRPSVEAATPGAESVRKAKNLPRNRTRKRLK